MAVDVIPAGASAVVTQERGEGMEYGYGSHHHNDPWVGQHMYLAGLIKDAEAHLNDAGSKNFIQTIQDISNVENHLGKWISDTEGRVTKNVSDGEARTTKAVTDGEFRTTKAGTDAEFRVTKQISDSTNLLHENVVGGEGRTHTAIIQQSGAVSRDIFDTRETVRSGITAGALAAATTDHGVQRSAWELSKEVAHIGEEMAECCCETKELIQSTSYAVRSEAAANYANVLLQFKEQALVSERLAAKSALDLCQTENRLAAQLAECCCDLKELVRAEAGATRDLVNATEAQNLRDRLQKAELKALLADRGHDH